MAFNIFSKQKKRYDNAGAPDMISQPVRSADKAVPRKKGFTHYTETHSHFFAPRDEIQTSPFRFGHGNGNGFYEPILPVMPHNEQIMGGNGHGTAEKSVKHHNKGSSGVSAGQSHAENTPADSGSEIYGSGQDASKGSFEDYYNRLLEALQSYGVNLSLPTLDEIYSQLEAFLRPAVDNAIEGRKDYGDAVLAELDADAYARGMGSSSYLSSMKYREYEDIARDIAALESDYGAELAGYIYDAAAELNDIQIQLSKAMLASSGIGRHYGHGGHGHSHGSDGDAGQSGGDEPEPSGTTFGQYQIYFECISDSETENFFHSNDPYWVELRSQMGIDLTEEEYQYLIDTYDTYGTGGSGHAGPAPKVPGGNGSWYHTPY